MQISTISYCMIFKIFILISSFCVDLPLRSPGFLFDLTCLASILYMRQTNSKSRKRNYDSQSTVLRFQPFYSISSYYLKTKQIYFTFKLSPSIFSSILKWMKLYFLKILGGNKASFNLTMVVKYHIHCICYCHY